MGPSHNPNGMGTGRMLMCQKSRACTLAQLLNLRARNYPIWLFLPPSFHSRSRKICYPTWYYSIATKFEAKKLCVCTSSENIVSNGVAHVPIFISPPLKKKALL